MTSFKLDSLSIFLILLFVIVFAMVFKNSWDSMLETKEGFAGMTLDGYEGGQVQRVYDNLYFDPFKKSLLEKTDTQIIKKSRDSTNAVEEGSGETPGDAEVKTFIHKSENGVYVLYVPFGEATFIHVMSGTNNFISQYFKGNYKSEKTYPAPESAFLVESGTDVSNAGFDTMQFTKSNKHELKTKTVKVDGSKFIIAMKYLESEVLVAFVESASSPGTFDILVDKQRTIENDESESKSIQLKMGDYEINLPQETAETLASKLGSQVGNTFSGIFMKNNDYNSDYIHKTQIVPGMGYDHYSYPQYDYDSGRPRRGGYGYYDRDVKEEERDGPRDENGNLLRDFGEGSASLLRDGAKGTADLARDTARGATDLAKDTVVGTKDLAKDTVVGTKDLAKDTVVGTKDLAKDTVSGATNLAKDTVSGATNLAKGTASGATNAIGNTLSGTGDFIQSSASGIGNFAKDAASGTVGLGKDIVGGTVGLGREIVGGVGSGVGGLLQNNPTAVGGGQGYGGGGGYQMGGYQNSYGGPQMRQTHGMDPYSYHGAVPPRPSCNYIPRTADFSAFGR